MLSAQLDGEDDPADRARVDEHLAGCAGCREWLDRAATVNRLTRTGVVADMPDLSAAILAALPAGAPAARSRRSLPVGRLVGARLRRSRTAGRVAGARRSLLAGLAAGGARSGRLGRVAQAWRGSAAAGAARAGAARAGEALGAWRPTRAKLTTVLFLALAAVGAVQLILGLAQVGGGSSTEHVHGGTDATAGHLWHESAAWNVAVGAAYLFLALRRSRPAGLVPMLTAFVGMLLLLSVNDLSASRVDGTRLVSHGFVILGYLLVVALSKISAETATPPGARADRGSGWRARLDDDDELEVTPRLRLVPRGHGPLTAGTGPALDPAALDPAARAVGALDPAARAVGALGPVARGGGVLDLVARGARARSAVPLGPGKAA